MKWKTPRSLIVVVLLIEPETHHARQRKDGVSIRVCIVLTFYVAVFAFVCCICPPLYLE